MYTDQTIIKNLWKVIVQLSEMVPDCFWNDENDKIYPKEDEFVLVRSKELGNKNETTFFDKWVNGRWKYHSYIEHYLWMKLEDKLEICESMEIYQEKLEK